VKETLGRLEVEFDGDRERRHLAMRGSIDERSLLSTKVDDWSAREVTIDTAGVQFINSIGVREWMRLLRGLTDGGARVRLERCAEVIIAQINMIDEARGDAAVISFHAPYLCGACGCEASMLIEVAPHAAALRRMEAPPLPCPDCRGQMHLHEVPERFFSFLSGVDDA
jgi:hypothetical protein